MEYKKNVQPYHLKLSGIIVPLTILLIWYIVTNGKHTFFSSPSEVLFKIWELLKNGTLATKLDASMIRVAEGFTIGTSAGLLFGIITGSSLTMKKMLIPFFHGIRQVPMIAWIPLIVMWFGTGSSAQIVFIAWSAFYPMALNTFDGIRNIPFNILEVGKVFEYSRLKIMLKIMIPAAIPSIKTGMILSLNISWTLLVAAEIMTSEPTGGLGDLLSEGRETLNISLLITGMVVMGIIGFCLNILGEFCWSIILRKKTFTI